MLLLIFFFFTFLSFTTLYFLIAQGTIPSQSFVSIPAPRLHTELQVAVECSVLASVWCFGSLGVHRPVDLNAAVLGSERFCGLLVIVLLVCGVVHIHRQECRVV